jgi:large subunit ribosomal protein L9
MSKTTILLREDIDNLGGRGEVVEVKAGYARNFLLPRNMATLATKGNIKQVAAEKAALLKKAASERATAELQADQLKGLSLSFERKAGEEGALFGSVTSMDVAEAIQAKGYEIDRRKLVMKDAIKHTGEYTVGWKLHRDVVVQIPVTVTPEGGEVPAPATETKKAEEATEAPAAEAAAEATENTDTAAE